MAKVYALMEFIDAAGVKHTPADGEFDLPRNTDEEKADFEKYLDYKIVTRSEAQAHPDPKTPGDGQRASRERRKD